MWQTRSLYRFGAGTARRPATLATRKKTCPGRGRPFIRGQRVRTPCEHASTLIRLRRRISQASAVSRAVSSIRPHSVIVGTGVTCWGGGGGGASGSRMGSRSVAVHDALGTGAVPQLPPPVTVAVFSASVSGEPVTVAVTL